jgi:heme/copper-type cytochrome/quinol oxidase subunit 2
MRGVKSTPLQPNSTVIITVITVITVIVIVLVVATNRCHGSRRPGSSVYSDLGRKCILEVVATAAAAAVAVAAAAAAATTAKTIAAIEIQNRL